MLVLTPLESIFGFMLVNWINYGLSYVGGPIAWRLPLALQFIFIFVLWGTTPWLPESPRWLIAHGRLDEATRILADLDRKDADDPMIIAHRQEILYSVEYEREHSVRWRDLMRGRSKPGTKAVRRILLGAGTQAMQQVKHTSADVSPSGYALTGTVWWDQRHVVLPSDITHQLCWSGV